MKSTQVYRELRQSIAPALKERGYRRTDFLLGWYKAVADRYVVFWYQVSQDGWDRYAGSKFIVEFGISDDASLMGRTSWRKRISGLLERSERLEAQHIQNGVIQALQRPPADYWLLEALDPDSRDWYLSKFGPESPYSAGEGIWFRYGREEDVARWAEWLRPKVIRTLEWLEKEVADS